MLNRKLDENGDYTFGVNRSNFIEGDEALAQAIKTRILLFYNEWWEDLNSGIPMFQNIIGQVRGSNINLAIQSLLTKRIMEFSEVKSVEFGTMNMDSERRLFELEVKCLLKSGSDLVINISV